MRYLILLLAFGIFQISCSEKKLFERNDALSSFENILTESDDFNILDYLYFYNGGGVALGDINGDGLVDVYLSANQTKNKLFLNKGNMTFEDVTEKAGVAGNSDWNTGAVMADVNADGLLDIYVCAVVGLRGLNGYNELFINNGDGTFTERATEFGLDYDSYSSNAAFLDFDKDGDLDMYLLNHAVHTQESFGKAELRNQRSYETGDKLLRNDGGKFTDVSEEAGIFGGINGYGLGIAISDFNSDGYPDIYVGNDFHEDDYYYINNGNGTFTESLKKYFGSSSRFSMGNDVTDINHDGLPDILTLDMLPQDEEILKKSEGDDNLNIMNMRINEYGYHYQFTRNMLHINQGNGQFIESALMSGVSATDWSWSALFADYDQDGEQDIFIANGIPRRPNDLDFIRFVSSDQIKDKIDATKLVDQEALEMMPSGEAQNYFFLGDGNYSFEDKSELLPKEKLFSTACAYADLDNDGDLDLVVNNVNGPAEIYVNTTDASANYLKVRLEYAGSNPMGIGAKVTIKSEGLTQTKELYTVRGFQSSSELILHFGLGNNSKIDSIEVQWPDQTIQVLTDLNANQTLSIKYQKGQVSPKNKAKGTTLFTLTERNLGVNFEHVEDRYIDFDRQKLMPYQCSDRGPAVAIGDLNGDGTDDIFFGGSKFKPSTIFISTSEGFELMDFGILRNDSIKEDIDALIADFDKDGSNDLIIASGGGDFFGKSAALLESYFKGGKGEFMKLDFPAIYENNSVLKSCDYDLDGDLDLFLGGHLVTGDFGKIPSSYLLKNTNGKFSIVDNQDILDIGMVTDASWADVDNDGDEDLIVVGEWMSPTLFMNDKGTFVKDTQKIPTMNGLWQAVEPYDFDADGDIDFIVGNWGLNSKYQGSEKSPVRMYYHDFDDNGSTETVVAIEKNGKYYSVESMMELTSQMVSLKKKYTTFSDAAGKSVDELFSESIKNAKLFEVTELRSGYLKNEDGNFKFIPFALTAQLAPIMTILVDDLDDDGKNEAVLGGNYFGLKPHLGRLGSFPGVLIDNENLIAGNEIGLDLLNKSVRSLDILKTNNRKCLMVTFNSDSVQIYDINK